MTETPYWLTAMRDPFARLVLELEETIVLETDKFYQAKGLRSLLLPVTTGSVSSPMGAGSDSKPVPVTIDGKETYLADSMQFLLEYGCRIFKDGCYYVMPTFRGEAVDERHLKQFFHSEAEIPGRLEDVMSIAEQYIKHLLSSILAKHSAEISAYTKLDHIRNFINNPIPVITFEDAIGILNKYGDVSNFIRKEEGIRSLTNEGERALINIHGGSVWVTDYDEMSVPFYQKSYDGKARNADLLFGIGEVVGCGERHEKSQDVKEALTKHKVEAKNYEWYVTMRSKYPMQTSGFGMGVERLLLFILGRDDIREMQIFRRFNNEGDIV